MLALLAVLAAASIVIGGFSFRWLRILRIHFTFIVNSLAGWIGGPVAALVYGFVADILGFIIHPTGGFFPGYTLSGMLGALLYALFFLPGQNFHPGFSCASCRSMCWSISCWACCGAPCSTARGYYYYLANSIVKNLVLLPLETIVMAVIIGAMLPIAVKAGWRRFSSWPLLRNGRRPEAEGPVQKRAPDVRRMVSALQRPGQTPGALDIPAAVPASPSGAVVGIYFCPLRSAPQQPRRCCDFFTAGNLILRPVSGIL